MLGAAEISYLEDKDEMESDAMAAMVREPGLWRSREDRMVAGVCGGLARWIGWSPTSVRVLYVIVSILSAAFPGILVYLALWLFMPLGPR